MKIKLTGTIEVPFEYYSKLDVLPYADDKRGGDLAVSFFIKNNRTVHLPRNFQKFLAVSKFLKKNLEITDERLEVPLKNLLPLKDIFALREYQIKPVISVMRWLKDGRSLNSCVLQAEPGFGKEQPYSEPVLTPKGWVTMGSLKIGDKVINFFFV